MPMVGAALDPQVRGQLRSVTLAAATILAIVVTFAWFSVPDGSGTAFLAGLAGIVLLPLTALVGIGVMMIYAGEGRRISRDAGVPDGQRRVAAWMPVVAGLALFALAQPAAAAGAWARRQMLLTVLEPAFGRMIAADAAGRSPPAIRYGDRPLTMTVEPTSPRRYYFALDGMADNSAGFVYDPTDAVLAARGWGPGQSFTAPRHVREWFGGDIVGCSRVRGHFHYCGLT